MHNFEKDYVRRRIVGYLTDPGAVPGSSTNMFSKTLAIKRAFFVRTEPKKQAPASSACFNVEFFDVCLFLAPVQFFCSGTTPIIRR